MGVPDTVVDLAFSLRGRQIAVDHGYALFGAISRVLPELHGDANVGIHPIRGQLAGSRRLTLTGQSQMVLRLPAMRVPSALHLAGQQLDLDGATIGVGIPTVQALRPAPALVSRLVVIKGFLEPSAFLDAARRQIEALGVGGRVALVARKLPESLDKQVGRAAGEPIRRTLRVRDKTVVGFALAVTELTADESIRVQEAGVGGRRRFGCGLFMPLRG